MYRNVLHLRCVPFVQYIVRCVCVMRCSSMHAFNSFHIPNSFHSFRFQVNILPFGWTHIINTNLTMVFVISILWWHTEQRSHGHVRPPIHHLTPPLTSWRLCARFSSSPFFLLLCFRYALLQLRMENTIYVYDVHSCHFSIETMIIAGARSCLLYECC